MNEESFWPHVTRRISSFGQQLATLEGLEGISPGRNLQAIRHGNFAVDCVLGDEGYERDRAAGIGIDGKTVIKDAVTLDLTVNSDFSQAESDEPQVTIYQRVVRPTIAHHCPRSATTTTPTVPGGRDECRPWRHTQTDVPAPSGPVLSVRPPGHPRRQCLDALSETR